MSNQFDTQRGTHTFITFISFTNSTSKDIGKSRKCGILENVHTNARYRLSPHSFKLKMWFLHYMAWLIMNVLCFYAFMLPPIFNYNYRLFPSSCFTAFFRIDAITCEQPHKINAADPAIATIRNESTT